MEEGEENRDRPLVSLDRVLGFVHSPEIVLHIVHRPASHVSDDPSTCQGSRLPPTYLAPRVGLVLLTTTLYTSDPEQDSGPVGQGRGGSVYLTSLREGRFDWTPCNLMTCLTPPPSFPFHPRLHESRISFPSVYVSASLSPTSRGTCGWTLEDGWVRRCVSLDVMRLDLDDYTGDVLFGRGGSLHLHLMS